MIPAVRIISVRSERTLYMEQNNINEDAERTGKLGGPDEENPLIPDDAVLVPYRPILLKRIADHKKRYELRQQAQATKPSSGNDTGVT